MIILVDVGHHDILKQFWLQKRYISASFKAWHLNKENPQTLMFTGFSKLPELGSNQQPHG